MPLIAQAVAASKNQIQKSRENVVKPKQYLCKFCKYFVLTKVNSKKHYTENHPGYHFSKKIQEDEFYNCTIL